MRPPYPDLQRHHPLRQLAWRWQRAHGLLAHQRYFSRWRDDAQTGRLLRFLRDLARRPRPRAAAAATRYPDLWGASRLHQDGAQTRLLVEARLLAGQRSPEIASLTGVPAEVVDAYESGFFAVRDGLDAPDGIRLRAIGPEVRPGTAIPDRGALLKAFAFYGGSLALNAVLPYLVRGKDLFDPPLDLSTAEGRQEQAVRLAVAVHLLPRDAATDARLHQIMLLLHERERKRPVRPAPAALVAENLDATLHELAADALSERADDARLPAVAEVEAVCRQIPVKRASVS